MRQLFTEAVELPAERRSGYLDRECGADEELRRDVERLLAGIDGGGLDAEFLEEPLVEALRRREDDAPVDLTGVKLRDYEVGEVIGEGGMGRVFRGRDTQLGRDVALKVLATTPGRKSSLPERIKREARILATLNHPNIGGIYGIEEYEGRTVLVLECLEGETLASCLESRALRLDEAIEIARQVAEALEAAHDKGIVHRDLKPANVVLTRQGIVKVLDFGIAKLLHGEVVEPVEEPSRDSADPAAEVATHVTAVGQLIGTVDYMSPEQVQGLPVDRRADIWAFGCVLFELLAGSRPFEAADRSAAITRILEGEPDWHALPASTPRWLLHLVRRCLEKAPRRRLQAIGEARLALEDRGQGALGTSEGMRASRAGWIAGAATLVLLAAWAGWETSDLSRRTESIRRLSLPLENGFLSPDGRNILVLRDDALWAHSVTDGATRRLEGSDGALNPEWDLEGGSLLFRRDERIWRLRLDGSPPLELTEVPQGVFYGLTSTSDGRVVFSVPDGLYEVPAVGGIARRYLERDPETEPALWDPQGVPGGDLLLAIPSEGRIELLRGGVRSTLLELPDAGIRDPKYSATGHIVFTRWGDFLPSAWAVPVSLRSASALGEPFVIAVAARDPTPATDGSLLHRTEYLPETQLVWVDRGGVIVDTLGGRYSELRHPAIAPDGRRVAVSAYDGERRAIWIFDRLRGGYTPLTTANDGSQDYPFWHPTDQVMGYTAIRRLVSTLVARRIGEGVGFAIPLGSAVGRDAIIGSFSPASSLLAFQKMSETTGADLWTRELSPDAEPEPLVQTRQHEGYPDVRRDGRWLAYQGGATGSPEIFVSGFPVPLQRQQVSNGGGTAPRWSWSGSELFFWSANTVMSVSVEDRERQLRFGTPEPLFTVDPSEFSTGQFDVSPHGLFVLVRRTSSDSDSELTGVILLENWVERFDRAPTGR